ncbi:MAG: site-specific DNA-methyltransferase [Alkaliphilus sp.]|nr:site-specific DNA-methyltransferase [Alkaliphilus sp.]
MQNSTKTSSFGTKGRVNHDSSDFYNSRLYGHHKKDEKTKYIECEVDKKKINRIYCKSSENMNELPDNSVHLMITSPPYNVKKEYDEDLTLNEYRHLLKTVFLETYKKLVIGGRACINIANVGRKPYIPLHSYIIQDMLEIGFEMRGEVIWDKAASAAPSTAWGSWMSASNPVLRDTHEYILIFSKESFSRKKKDKINTIKKEEFLEWTKSIWTFPTVSARSIGHPAPFPEELPNRLIQLYSFESDIILDPFCGSGTTCIAALKSGRNYVGYDIKPEYVELSRKRISQCSEQINIFDMVSR